MWDRNNPYAFFDPTGFEPQELAQCSCSNGAYETISQAKARAKSQRNPLPKELKYRNEIFAAAVAHGIDPVLFAAMAAQESGGPDVNNGDANKSGGGLFQINASQWKTLLAEHHGGKSAADNAEVAAIIMSDDLSVANGNVDSALRRWNSGTLTGGTSLTRWGDGKTLDYPASIHRHEQMLQKMLGNQ
jgi:hypothetical protein